jgi:hypothetical protein
MRRAAELTAAKIKSNKPGSYCDGKVTGLYIRIQDRDHKYFLLRYNINGKTRKNARPLASAPDF